MSHLDPDRLALLALGDECPDEHETGHLGDCVTCRAEVDELRSIVELGRGTQGLHELPAAPEHLWQRISAELAGSQRAEPPPAVRLYTDPPPAPASPAVDELAVRRAVKRGWLRTALVAAAAAVVAVAGTVLVLDGTGPQQPSGTVACSSARVELAAVPGAPSGVRGFACLVDVDGRQELRVHAEGMPAPVDADYEVWLLDTTSLQDPAGLRMEKMGTMGSGPDRAFELASVDLSRYRIVDISAEPHDGNPQHSGNSVLRGQL